MENRAETPLQQQDPPVSEGLTVPAVQGTIERVEKGSLRSMWELLMQLRILLPYLTRLVPLLDRGLVKAAPDLTEFRNGLQEIHAGSHELAAQVRNQAAQLERIDEQLLRLREIGEHAQKETRELSLGLHALTRWIRGLTVLALLAFAVAVAVLAIQLSHL